MSIFLIRHGETALNAARVVQPPDTPLNQRGVAQADRLARRLVDLGVEQILASDQARAKMTAERVYAVTGAPITLDPLLCERNFGDIRGTPYVDLGLDIFALDYEPPGGENWQVFHDRVDVVWARVTDLASRGSGNLAVVTHGLVCRSLAARRLELPPTVDREPERWGNTSLTIVDRSPPWKVTLLNCTAHLDREVANDRGAVSGL